MAVQSEFTIFQADYGDIRRDGRKVTRPMGRQDDPHPGPAHTPVRPADLFASGDYRRKHNCAQEPR